MSSILTAVFRVTGHYGLLMVASVVGVAALAMFGALPLYIIDHLLFRPEFAFPAFSWSQWAMVMLAVGSFPAIGAPFRNTDTIDEAFLLTLAPLFICGAAYLLYMIPL